MLYNYNGSKIVASSREEAISKIIAGNDYITVDTINEKNYKDYIGKKVNVTGNVFLVCLKLKEIPITFGTVGGSFYCANNELVSLKGSPKLVGKHFDCKFNKLTSLEYCPVITRGMLSCSHNNLTSLYGCPDSIQYVFDCSFNKLRSLDGCPKYVYTYFDCSNNKKKFTIEDVKSLCKVNGDIYV